MTQQKVQKIKKKWGNDDIPDLTGKTTIVTGANSGTGFQASKVLASKGTTVIMACRSLEKGAEAARTIQEEHPNASTKVMELDLADLSSVRSFAEEFKQNYASLELLLNNAGVMQTPARRTADGFELQFGTNHLGHFALTGLLLEPLLQAKEARVVTMSSAAHSQGKIHFDNINLEKKYGRTKAYAQSKLANLLFAYELQRKFESKATSAISVGVHPGYTATNLQSAGPGMEGGRRHWARLYWISNKIFAQGIEMGALPLLCAATDSAIEGGDYIGPSRLRGWRGHPKKARSSKRSYNLEDAEQLWELSEQMTGVKYEF
ncbi:MAG: oxidoreductase [Candidatus Heimdallarchaeota archaeon]